jgi:hypothetical protein
VPISDDQQKKKLNNANRHQPTVAGVLRLLAVLALGLGAAAFFGVGAFFGSAGLAFSFFGAPRFFGAAVLAVASFYTPIISDNRDRFKKSVHTLGAAVFFSFSAVVFGALSFFASFTVPDGPEE